MKLSKKHFENIRASDEIQQPANISFTSQQSNEIPLKNSHQKDKSVDLSDISFDLEDINLPNNFTYRSQSINKFNLDKTQQTDRYQNLKKLIANENKLSSQKNNWKLNEEHFKIFGDKADYEKYTQYLKTDKKKSQEQFLKMCSQLQEENSQKQFKKKTHIQDQPKIQIKQAKRIDSKNNQQYKIFSLEFGLGSASQSLEDGKIDVYDAIDFISQDKQQVKKIKRNKTDRQLNPLQIIKEQRSHHLQSSLQESKIKQLSSSFEDLKFKFQTMLNQLKQQEQQQNHIEKQLSKIQSQFWIKSQIKNAASSQIRKKKKSPQQFIKVQTKKSPQYAESKIISNTSEMSLQYSIEKQSSSNSKFTQIDLKIKNLQSKVKEVSQQQKHQNQQINNFLSKLDFNLKKNLNKRQTSTRTNLKTDKLKLFQLEEHKSRQNSQYGKYMNDRSRTFSGLRQNIKLTENFEKTIINPTSKNNTTRPSYKLSLDIEERKRKQIDFNYASPFQIQLSQLKEDYQQFPSHIIKNRKKQLNQSNSSFTKFYESQIKQVLVSNSKRQMQRTVIQNFPINSSNFVYMNYQVSINSHFNKHDDVFKPISAEIIIKNNCKFEIEDVFAIVYGPNGSNLLVQPKRVFYNSISQSQQKKFTVWLSPQAVQDRGFQLQITYLRCGIRKKISLKINLPIIGYLLEVFKFSQRQFLQKYNIAKKDIYVVPKKLKINQIRWYEQIKSKLPLTKINDDLDTQNLIYGLVFKYWSYQSLIFLKIICMPQGKVALCLRTEHEIVQTEQLQVLALIDEVLFKE